MTGHLNRVFGQEAPPGFVLEGLGQGLGQGVGGVGATPARNALNTSLYTSADIIIASPTSPVAGYTTPSSNTQYMGIPNTSKSSRHSPPKSSALRPYSVPSSSAGGGGGGATTAPTVSPGRCTPRFPPSPPSAPTPLRVTYTSAAVPTPASYAQNMTAAHSSSNSNSNSSSSSKRHQQQYSHAIPRSPASLALVGTPPPVAVPALMQLLNERDVTRLELDQCLVLLDEVTTLPHLTHLLFPLHDHSPLMQ